MTDVFSAEQIAAVRALIDERVAEREAALVAAVAEGVEQARAFVRPARRELPMPWRHVADPGTIPPEVIREYQSGPVTPPPGA